jgi:hypothetical protein
VGLHRPRVDLLHGYENSKKGWFGLGSAILQKIKKTLTKHLVIRKKFLFLPFKPPKANIVFLSNFPVFDIQ